MKITLLSSCALALLLLCGFRAPPEGTYQGVGTEAPDASLAELGGKARRLSEGEAGWTLLKFGTTWCPNCSREVDELNQLAPDLQKLGIRVVEVFLKESPATVQGEVKERPRKYKGLVLVDRKGETIPLYGLSVIPRLFLVDPKGVVRVDSQFLDAAKLRQALSRAVQAR